MDTTSNALARTLDLLSTHQDVQDKLRAEILDKVGPTRRPTYEDIRDMKCR